MNVSSGPRRAAGDIVRHCPPHGVAPGCSGRYGEYFEQGGRYMFRTGHRTDPAPSAEPMAEPTRIEPKTVEAEAAKTPTAPPAVRSAARPIPMDRPGAEDFLGNARTVD